MAVIVGYFGLHRKYTVKCQLLLVRKYMELFSLEGTLREGTFFIFVIKDPAEGHLKYHSEKSLLRYHHW